MSEAEIKEEKFAHQFSSPIGKKLAQWSITTFCAFRSACVNTNREPSHTREFMGLESRGLQHVEKVRPWQGVPEPTPVLIPTGGWNKTRWGLMQVSDAATIDICLALCFLIIIGKTKVVCSCYWPFFGLWFYGHELERTKLNELDTELLGDHTHMKLVS